MRRGCGSVNAVNEMRDVVRNTLDDAVTGLDATVPPWGEIQRGMRRARGRRLRRTATGAAGAVVAVAALATSAVTAWPSLGGSAEPAGSQKMINLDPDRPLGRLTDDESWTRGFAAAVGRRELASPDGEQPGIAAPEPGSVDVLFADDVGAYRVALVLARYRRESPTPEYHWFAAARGAGPDALAAGSGAVDGFRTSDGGPGTGEAWVVVDPVVLDDGADAASSVFVGLTSRMAGVDLYARPELAANGTVDWQRVSVGSSSPGVYTAVLPGRPRGPVGVVLADQGWAVWKGAYLPSAEGPTDGILDGVLPAVHGDRAPNQDRLAMAVRVARAVAGLSDKAPARLLGSIHSGDSEYAVVAVTAPSGGHVVSAVYLPVSAACRAPSGEWRCPVQTALYPAGRVEDLAFAWDATPPSQEVLDTSPVALGRPVKTAEPSRQGLVGLLGPAGATAALVPGAGTTGRVVLGEGVTVAEKASPLSEDDRRVTFLDAAGAELATAPETGMGLIADPEDTLDPPVRAG